VPTNLASPVATNRYKHGWRQRGCILSTSNRNREARRTGDAGNPRVGRLISWLHPRRVLTRGLPALRTRTGYPLGAGNGVRAWEAKAVITAGFSRGRGAGRRQGSVENRFAPTEPSVRAHGTPSGLEAANGLNEPAGGILLLLLRPRWQDLLQSKPTSPRGVRGEDSGGKLTICGLNSSAYIREQIGGRNPMGSVVRIRVFVGETCTMDRYHCS